MSSRRGLRRVCLTVELGRHRHRYAPSQGSFDLARIRMGDVSRLAHLVAEGSDVAGVEALRNLPERSCPLQEVRGEKVDLHRTSASFTRRTSMPRTRCRAGRAPPTRPVCAPASMVECQLLTGRSSRQSQTIRARILSVVASRVTRTDPTTEISCDRFSDRFERCSFKCVNGQRSMRR